MKIASLNVQNMFLISMNAPNDISAVIITCRLFRDPIKHEFKQDNIYNNNSYEADPSARAY